MPVPEGNLMVRWMLGAGIGVLVAGIITIGLALHFFGGLFVDGGNFVLLTIGSLIAILGLVLLGVGGALRFVAAFLLGFGIFGIALEAWHTLVFGSGYWSSPVGYLLNWGSWWGVPSLALGLILLAVSFWPRPSAAAAS